MCFWVGRGDEGGDDEEGGDEAEDMDDEDANINEEDEQNDAGFPDDLLDMFGVPEAVLQAIPPQPLVVNDSDSDASSSTHQQ